ncbi:unnamed protein product [Camellia sinensis]
MQMRMTMVTPSQAPTTSRCSVTSRPQLSHPNHSSLFSHRSRRPKFFSSTADNNPPIPKRLPYPLTVSNSSDGGPATKPSPPPPPSLSSGGDSKSVPLEGVIQFEKPNSSSLFNKWGFVWKNAWWAEFVWPDSSHEFSRHQALLLCLGSRINITRTVSLRVALLAGGDVLALLLFSAIGRFSHGFSVFDTETLRTADPFIAGWFLSAYFLGGYGEDGRGMNGWSKAVIAAAKSWSLGIPVGLIIRATAVGRIPQPNFILVTMGSTAVLLIGWRALLFSIFLKDDKSKKSDIYRRGSPFEFFESSSVAHVISTKVQEM